MLQLALQDKLGEQGVTLTSQVAQLVGTVITDNHMAAALLSVGNLELGEVEQVILKET